MISERVIGVGGVLSHSIPEQLQSSEPTQARLEKILQSRPGKTDKDIGSQFAETDTTNLSLALGHMKAFGIEKFTAEQINLTDGLLLSPKY
jgi:exopolyphosphatase/guanosine-5'-triphosphate,3'-diphosphate pyrophosphatase